MNKPDSQMTRLSFLKRSAGATVGLLAGQQLLLGKSVAFAAGGNKALTAAPLAPLTLEQSLRLAGRNLLATLNPEQNFLPYWEIAVELDYRAEMKAFWPAHNLGRWWDAMMRLNTAIGFEVPRKIEAAMEENVRIFFDNPDHISLQPASNPLYPPTNPKHTIWDLHSLREGLLALNALAGWKKKDWAATMGRKMVQSVNAKLRDDGTWDLEKFDACQKRGKRVNHDLRACATHGRMLEALIWFHETTGDTDTLQLIHRLAHWHFDHTTQPDGKINPDCNEDHTHSYFGTLRGLLLYGRLTQQHKFIERVAAAYRVSVLRHVHESGYTSHNMGTESIGETTSPGDAAQLALWLHQAGHGEFIDDTERLVRARILPSQIVQTPPLHPTTNDNRDAHRDIAKRIIGAYGGCHFHPHAAKRAVTDVTAADVHTLVDVYRHVATSSEKALTVRFHLDYEDSKIQIKSRRGKQAELTVKTKVKGPVALRVPKWTPRASVQIRVGGELIKPVFVENFAWTDKVAAGAKITMEYDLPERQTREKDMGADYEIFWRGDDVVGIQPNSDFYPFYPDAPTKTP